MMQRVPFSQLLKQASVDIEREYSRLYELFFDRKVYHGTMSLRDYCAKCFKQVPFRGTCLTLSDFNRTYKISFAKMPVDFNLDYLVSFCEYSYNLLMYSDGKYDLTLDQYLDSMEKIEFFQEQVLKVIESIGYMELKQDEVTNFVPKDQAAISVAEIVNSSLSYRVIEYNHHSMKGDLDRKKAILIALADKLEPLRDKLRQINASLEDKLFFLFNNVNIRHNNSDLNGKKFIRYVASMSGNDIEKWYDETYQLCLLAFLELDNVERKARVDQLKKDIEANK